MSAQRRVGYARVSTESGEQLAALENQQARLEALGLDEIVTDVESGMTQDREGYLHLLDLVDRRQVAELFVTRLDRLGRDAAATDAFLLACERRGVVVTALDGGRVDVETPTGFLLSRISTSLAEMESRMLSLRIKRGLEQARLRRRPLRGRAPWGYRVSADRSCLELDPVEGKRAERFLNVLRQADWRMNTALDLYGEEIPLHSCRAVKAWLLNPILRGGIGYQQQANHRFTQIVWDCHPPLLSHAEFAAVEKQLENNARRWGRNSGAKPRLLTGLCVCGLCRKRMNYAGGRTHPAVICKERGCEQRFKSTHEATIALAINAALSERAEELATKPAAKSTPEELALEEQIAALEKLGDSDLAEVILAKRARLSQLQQAQAPPALVQAFRDSRVWELADYEQLRQLYQQTVAQVVVTRQEVEQVVLRF